MCDDGWEEILTAVLVTGLQRTGTNAIKSALVCAYPHMENHGEIFQPPSWGTIKPIYPDIDNPQTPMGLTEFINKSNNSFLPDFFERYIDRVNAENAIIDIKYDNYQALSNAFTNPVQCPLFLRIWQEKGLPIIRTFRKNTAELVLSGLIASSIKLHHSSGPEATAEHEQKLSNANVTIDPRHLEGRIRNMAAMENLFHSFLKNYENLVTANYDFDFDRNTLGESLVQRLQDILGSTENPFSIRTSKPKVSKADAIANLDEIRDYFRGNAYEGMVKSALFYN